MANAQQTTAWLRDTQEGRDVLAKAAAQLCRDCPRIRKLQDKCKTCQHREAPRTTSEILDRLPPFSMESERSLIGSVLIDPKAYKTIRPALDPADFYSVTHAAIWRRIRELLDKGDALDETLLAERLRMAGELDDVGGVPYLTELVSGVAVSIHAPHYAAIVREKAGIRRLVWTLLELVKAAHEPSAALKEGPLAELLKRFAAKLKNYREKP